ncbi:Csu type fimbrial protein [Nostoc sp.]|uniref:Csu type fimbrial protein n=1 Tax=Nostoc sp. TaxID=1180 RepID=UPI002FF56089
MMLRRFALASVLLIASSAAPAMAGTATSNLGVSALVTANCTISTTPVAFGNYDPIGANASTDLNGTGSVATTCTNGSSVVITLGQGSNADTGSTDAVPLRRAMSGSNYLSYSLYSDSARTTVWENTTGVAVTGTGTPVSNTVYGKMVAGQNVPIGSYTDTVVATVTY